MPNKTKNGKQVGNGLGGPLEDNAHDVLVACVIEGKPRKEVAEKYGVSPEGVRQFLLRHSEDVTTFQQEMLRSLLHIPITQKFHRLRHLDIMLNKTIETIEARAQQYLDSGLMVREPKWVGPAEGGELVWMEKYDAGLVREFRGLLHDAAHQLGQLPKPELIIQQNNTSIEYTSIQQDIKQALTRFEQVTKGAKQ